MRKLIAGFAVSLDGYIEGPNGEYDWIIYDQEQFKELAKYWERMDTMFYGRKTYEVCVNMQSGSKKKQKNPFAHMKHYVFSKALEKVADGFILLNGDLEKEVMKIKNEPGKDIAVFGGAALVSSLINLDLIDELVLAICPVLLGEGKPFFVNIKERKNYRLKEVKSFASGLVSLTYEKPTR
jgi:dihydrofolate reductase